MIRFIIYCGRKILLEVDGFFLIVLRNRIFRYSLLLIEKSIEQNVYSLKKYSNWKMKLERKNYNLNFVRCESLFLI